jgi:hypothetical protein
VFIEDHPQRHRKHRGIGKRVAQRQRGQQILGTFEQLRDNFARTRMLFGQLPRLPFAEGKQRRFRQREKEACARENQNRRHRHRHARSLTMPGKPRHLTPALSSEKVQKIWGDMRIAPQIFLSKGIKSVLIRVSSFQNRCGRRIIGRVA